jgi:methanogenic corrinoid protein MtbC1
MPDPVRPRGGHLWTSAEVASAFRVGVSSIKRWTDEGELESVRTPGAHRRYTLAAIYRFARIRSMSTELLPTLEQSELFGDLPQPADTTLFAALLAGDNDAVRSLVAPQVESLVQRASFLDRVVGDALREIGDRWQRGELSVDQEHAASHMIAEAVDRLRPRIERPARVVLLACPPGEWHDLPLRLVRLIFEWKGWRTEFVGAQLPWQGARAAVERIRPTLVAFSARHGEAFDEPDFEAFVDFCSQRGVAVVVGGGWARGGTAGEKGYSRFRTLRGFEKWLQAFSVPLFQERAVRASND